MSSVVCTSAKMQILFIENICVMCLSSDRNVLSIENTDLYHIYCLLLNETPRMVARVCVWCAARLRRARALRTAASEAHARLIGFASQLSLSSTSPYPLIPIALQQCPATTTSYPVVKEELEVDGDEDKLAGTGDGYKVEVDDVSLFVSKDTGSFLEPQGSAILPPLNACREKRETEPEHREAEAFVHALVHTLPAKEKKQKKSKPKEKVKVKAKVKTKAKAKMKVKSKKKKEIEQIETESISGVSCNSALGDEDYDPGPENGGNDVDENDASDHDGGKQGNDAAEKIKIPPGERPQCAECGKTFSSRKTYRYHLNVLHRGMNRHPCPRCGKVYQWKSNLGRHMRTHKARDLGELYCAPCDKMFSSVATYRQHLKGAKTHLQDEDYTFSCTQCEKRFASKTRLRDHVDWDHLQKVKFRCQICNKAFKCHTSMYVHTQNVHSERGGKDNLCHVCGKSYRNAAKLKYHIVAMHSGSTPYGCERCGAAFGWYSSLYRHVREVHYKKKVSNKKVKRGKASTPPLPTAHNITALV